MKKVLLVLSINVSIPLSAGWLSRCHGFIQSYRVSWPHSSHDGSDAVLPQHILRSWQTATHKVTDQFSSATSGLQGFTKRAQLLTYKGRVKEYASKLPDGRDIGEFLESCSHDAYALETIKHRHEQRILDLTPQHESILRAKIKRRRFLKLAAGAAATGGALEKALSLLGVM